MKITKKQLKRIIREEKQKLLRETGMSQGAGDPDVYDEVMEQTLRLAEDTLNNWGTEGYAADAIVAALRDAANMIENDVRLRG